MINSLIEQQHLCNSSRKVCYFTAAMLVPLERAGTNMAALYKLAKFWWNTFPKNTRMKNRTDLILGEIVYISIIYHYPDSRLFFNFFDCMEM